MGGWVELSSGSCSVSLFSAATYHQLCKRINSEVLTLSAGIILPRIYTHCGVPRFRVYIIVYTRKCIMLIYDTLMKIIGILLPTTHTKISDDTALWHP